MSPVRSLVSPGLASTTFCVDLLVEIVGVEDQRLPFGEKHPAVWPFRLPVASDVVDFSDVEIAGTHQFADVAIIREKFPRFVQCTITVVQQNELDP